MSNISNERTNFSPYHRGIREDMIFGPPVDLSFKKVDNMDDLASKRPRSIRVGKIPKRASSRKFLTSSIWLSNNGLTSMGRIENLIASLLDDPNSLAWVDLSFNNIRDVDEEITKFVNLKIFYLHGNLIADLNAIVKLRKLHSLRSLTLHGNSIESIPSYRSFVMSSIPQLQILDFSPILAEDRKKTMLPGFHRCSHTK